MHWRTLVVLGLFYPLIGPPALARAAPEGAAAAGAAAGKTAAKGAKAPKAKKVPTLPVTMVSEPPGATVYIDGKDNGARGVATATLKLHLPKGPHKVLLELPGYRPLEKDIEVSKHLEHFSFKLESAMERLLLRTTASEESKDAQIFIDGVSVGTVPTDVEIKPGQHTVEVRKPGFKNYTETLTVNPSEQKTLSVALLPEAKVATWGGFVFVNLDPDCGHVAAHLGGDRRIDAGRGQHVVVGGGDHHVRRTVLGVGRRGASPLALYLDRSRLGRRRGGGLVRGRGGVVTAAGREERRPDDEYADRGPKLGHVFSLS